MNFSQNLKEAVSAVRSNFLRAVLTILIVAFGITSLIGILTAIDGIKFWFANSFTRLGTNTFRIENRVTSIQTSGGSQKRKKFPPITYREALEFKREFGNLAPVSIVGVGNIAAQASYGGRSTQNNLQLFGADEDYLETANYKIDDGRNFTPTDIAQRKSFILIGKDAENQLFPAESALGRRIQISGRSYTVIGTFQKVGSVGLVGGDKICIIPSSTLIDDFPVPRRSFSLQVFVEELDDMETRIVEAGGVMRRLRHLKPREEDNFFVLKVESIIDNLLENLRFLTWGAYAISIITLFSASIGLMNIMLVSVTERTREIGVRKALGGTRRNILQQFLTEAILITQLGGLLGIAFGIGIGNLVGYFLGNEFIVPWNWALVGVGLCLVVGVASGIIPARRAASLDPIESLRHE